MKKEEEPLKQKILQIGYEQERDRLTWDGWDIHCGQGLDVLLPDQLGGGTWRSVSFEYNSEGWYMPGHPGVSRLAYGRVRARRAEMNCRYTDDQLKEDVERTIGIRAKDIEKIQFCGLWHIRFRAFGTDFYYYRADSDDTVHLVESPWQWK